ncbi:unnamed protein product [Paramecium sonneborni]|uniref:Uncharacterized protein n=1 Tax=Paramecium sonneborni TaxID=65129 RepID=A0A8S1NSF9_9CILI|nr:unnamed protein product [Paramecium sonneborni]
MSITLICLAPHKCKRKLCIQCQSKHGVEFKYFLQIDEYYQTLKKEIIDQFKLVQLRISFTILLFEIEQMMKNIQIDLKECIGYISNRLQKEDQLQIKLNNYQDTLLESSQTDWDYIAQILEGKTFREWYIQNNYFAMQLEKAKNFFQKNINGLNKIFKQEIKEILSKFEQHYSQNQEVKLSQERILEQEGIIWHYGFNIPEAIKIKLFIHVSNDNQIIYTKDGQIVRIDLRKEPIDRLLFICNGQETMENKIKRKVIGQPPEKEKSQMMQEVSTTREKKKDYGRKQFRIIGAKLKCMKLGNTQMIRKQEFGSIFMMIQKLEVVNTIVEVKKLENGLNQVMGFGGIHKSLIVANLMRTAKRQADGKLIFKQLQKLNN